MNKTKRKLIPPFISLLAAIISWTITQFFYYTLQSRLIILLFVIIGFYVMGAVFVAVLDAFEKKVNEREMEKVIEKEAESAEEENREENKSK